MPFENLKTWGWLANLFANEGLDTLGAKTCEQKGHRWRDVAATVLHEDGSVETLPRGSAQRCTRCGAERMADEQP